MSTIEIEYEIPWQSNRFYFFLGSNFTRKNSGSVKIGIIFLSSVPNNCLSLYMLNIPMSFWLNFPYLNNTHQCPTSNLYHSNHWHNDNHCHDSGTNWHHHLGSHFLDNFPRIWRLFFVFLSFYLREFYR